jgi:hypothetical protein
VPEVARRRSRPRRRGRTSWLVRHLGLSQSDYPAERRGFIGIQIDGLGYYVLKGALTRRYAPFLRKMVRRKGWKLHRYRVGLPATTPASQLAIFYGDNYDVPGFRWFEKDSRTLNITKSSSVCAELEKRFSARKPGVLKHGSSYGNMFSGDAESAALTLSRMGSRSTAKLSRLDLLIFFMLSFGLLFRILFLSLWETLIELYDHLSAMQNGRPIRDEGIFPIVRVFTNVVFREIAAQGCLVDIQRGVPFIYLNFSGYDEVAHHRGPNSIYARLVLRGIDAQVRKIVKEVERHGMREYDIVLLSDHGQSTTVPWEHLYGQSLTEFLLEKTALSHLKPLGADHRAKQVGRALAFTQWLRELEWMLPRGVGRVVKWLVGRLNDRLPDEATGIDWETASQLIVAPTGSLAHVYFTSTKWPLSIEEIRATQGSLVDALVEHESIGAIAARTNSGGTEVISKRGHLRIESNGVRTLVGEHPLNGYLEGEELLSEVVRLVHMPHAGDLVLFSAKHDGRVVNFQVEMGSHGGLHLDEQSGFILVPPDLDYDPAKVRNARDLYSLFARYHADDDAKDAVA